MEFGVGPSELELIAVSVIGDTVLLLLSLATPFSLCCLVRWAPNFRPRPASVLAVLAIDVSRVLELVTGCHVGCTLHAGYELGMGSLGSPGSHKPTILQRAALRTLYIADIGHFSDSLWRMPILVSTQPC